MPLGTGNGVARNLGWGKKINKKWISSPKAVAEVMQPAAAMCREMGESESQLGDFVRQVAGLGLLKLKVATGVACRYSHATMYRIRAGS